jgi:tetratricopeptide (TPR) repeat protein
MAFRPILVATATLSLLAAPACASSGDAGRPGGPAELLPFFRQGQAPSFPRLPGASEGIPSDGPAFGPDGPIARPRPGPGPDAADAPASAPEKPPTRAEALARLLDRLAKAQDESEARAIAGLVQGLWMQSGSDTADLLMTRAVSAMNGSRRDVAEALLDKIIALQPGWAEAWNKRATLRFLENDDAGSMADISHVLALEPRHFGALSGMGFILERHGEEAGALTALRRALSVYPQDADVRKAVDKLAPAVEGQAL